MRRSILKLAIMSVILLPACSRAPETANTEEPFKPYFQPSACAFNVPESIGEVDVRCGYIFVPSKRDTPTGHMLRLAVTVLKSRSNELNEVANIHLQGGPGSSSQSFFDSMDSKLFQALTSQFDTIIFGQRGTAESQALFCPWNNQEAHAGRVELLELANMEDEVETYVQENLACRDKLIAQGFDLEVYNTAEIAADVNDIRRALGYEELNLIGSSYGSYLAERVVRDYPRIVRAGVLEAVIAPQINWLANAPNTFDRAFNELFTACTVNEDCKEFYPNLELTFEELISDLNEKRPLVKLTGPDGQENVEVEVSGNMLFGVTAQLLYYADLLPDIPLFITLVKEGDYELLATAAIQLYGAEQGFADGMYNSVLCTDVVPFTTEAEVRQIAQQIDATYRDYLVINPLILLNTCPEWGSVANPVATQPVLSDIPVLLLSGYFDPITPPYYAELVAKGFKNGKLVKIVAGSHGAIFSGPSGECGIDLMKHFLDEPGVAQDTKCSESPLRFTLPQSEYARVQSLQSEISSVLPSIHPLPLR